MGNLSVIRADGDSARPNRVILQRDSRTRRHVIAVGVLAIIACIYYASFFRYGFTWADQGSVALIAEKLLRGERPYLDIELGYGILWFYPIALLYKVFGVHFDVVRAYFLAIAFASALISRALLLRLTGNEFVAFSAALVVLVFGGTMEKSYIPLLVISGAYVLFLYDARTLKPITAPWLALAANGIYLGVAFLIRGDIATVYTALFLFYHALLASLEAVRARSAERLLIYPGRIAAVVLVSVLVALPFAIQAKAGGYLEEFMRQYSQNAVRLIVKIQVRLEMPSGVGGSAAGTLLPRTSILSVWSKPRWVLLTFAPVIVLGSIGLYLCWDLLRRGLQVQALADFVSERAYLIVLSIGAFSAFPQFFVFRPDMWHLSEFAPGFFVLCAYFLYLLADRSGAPATFALVRRWGLYLLGAFCFVFLFAFESRYHDAYTLRHGRNMKFRVEDRIDVYLSRGEYQVLEQLDSLIRRESRPGEFVLCFPYCPGINFVTARPTFQRNLFVDDHFLFMKPNWLAEMREQIVARKPKSSSCGAGTSMEPRYRVFPSGRRLCTISSDRPTRLKAGSRLSR